MCDIINRIETEVAAGRHIPKPEAYAKYQVKGWGRRRGERALVYFIPNRKDESKPHQKGVTESEWRRAHEQLKLTGELRHSWFREAMPACYGEGSCNFTTIGGVFVMLGVAVREGRGTYRKV